MPKLKTYFYTKIENGTAGVFPHGRPYWVLDYYKNEMELLDATGAKIISQPDSVYLIPPGTSTSHVSKNGKTWVHTTLTFDDYSGFIKRLGIPVMMPVKIANTNELEQLMFSMESAQLSSSNFKHDAMNSYLILILICIYDSINTYAEDYHVNEGDDLRQVRHMIMNSTHIPWTLEHMAAQANMSVRAFQRKYKEKYGKSPIADLYDFRFRRAKQLLDNGFSINHILYSCGFKSPQHFSAFFKKHCGMTPTEYKTRNK